MCCLFLNLVDCFYNQILNPSTPTSDQARISPYNINTKPSRQVMRIKNIIQLLDPISNSQISHHKNCMADSKENK